MLKDNKYIMNEIALNPPKTFGNGFSREKVQLINILSEKWEIETSFNGTRINRNFMKLNVKHGNIRR